MLKLGLTGQTHDLDTSTHARKQLLYYNMFVIELLYYRRRHPSIPPSIRNVVQVVEWGAVLLGGVAFVLAGGSFVLADIFHADSWAAASIAR